MKFMRVGPVGREKPVALLSGGDAVDISAIVADLTPGTLGDGIEPIVDRVEAASDQLPRVELDGLRVGPPLAGVGKVICVGLNYREHAAEAGQPVPDEPVLFLKAPYTIVGPYDSVLIPPGSTKTDYEIELAVIIGRPARYLTADDQPLDHVAGYTISNDVSEREYQFERGGQWDKGKNCETFNPLGPFFVTRDEVPNPQELLLALAVNGEQRQRSSTADMIFDVAALVTYISRFMALLPGDVINTGTPAGVGSGFTPPRYLRDGDVVELTADRLGTQRQTFRATTGGER